MAVATLVWPRFTEERLRAIETAHTWAMAAVPASAVDRARVETQPTAHGWRVVFRDAQVPCALTSWGCRAGPSQTDETLVYRDVYVCVEYGTARGYMIAGMIRPVGGVQANTCQPVPSRPR
jgi:hypothetical protein